jgi:hypothetical protein
MKVRTSMLAVPIIGLIVGALIQPVGAQTSTYTRTVTSYDTPEVIERVTDYPAIIEDTPMPVDNPVIIERPSIIDYPAAPPMIIREHRNHAFHLGLFPLGNLNVF